jgi:hypothetical protein
VASYRVLFGFGKEFHAILSRTMAVTLASSARMPFLQFVDLLSSFFAIHNILFSPAVPVKFFPTRRRMGKKKSVF